MRRSRPGYTLLEVILAIAIGLLVLAALYIALDIQMRSIQTGRVIVGEANLARGVLNRISSDVRLHLALLTSSPTSQMASGTATSGSNSSSSSGSSGSSSSGSTSGIASSQGATNQASNDPSQMGQVNFGLVGEETQMTLFVSAPPRYNLSEGTQDGMCDQRMILYGFLPGQGLVRQETRMVLGDTDMSNTELLAPEVVDMRFRYFDLLSGSWQSGWDGSYLGPPAAIEIIVTLLPPEESAVSRLNRQPTVYRMVISVPTASVPSYALTGSGGAP